MVSRELESKRKIQTPFVDIERQVLPEWLDENGHMNVAYYLMVFDKAFYSVFEAWGVSSAQDHDSGRSSFAVETHLSYMAELRLGDSFYVETQLVDFDRKRIRWFMSMKRVKENKIAATCDWLVLFMNMKERRVAPMPDFLFDALGRIKEAHKTLPLPAQFGKGVAWASVPSPA